MYVPRTVRWKQVGRNITREALRLREATKKKYTQMAAERSSEWYHLSNNKETDERGSRASISVEGLRATANDNTSKDLKNMLRIARSYFEDLHTPAPVTRLRTEIQEKLLQEVEQTYVSIPGPVDEDTGTFTPEELGLLKKKMPSTAPGPDDLPYWFWKHLAKQITAYNNTHPNNELIDFWVGFSQLTEDLLRHGTNRLGFKNANISLFYKKGDPTLVANYRPISSMNTDCKMYTNLINARLQKWAINKIHQDQKGFIPHRIITDHTRLATAVHHYSSNEEEASFLISLDQSKVYDRTDPEWLLRILDAMGVNKELISNIKDLLNNCRSRVRINSGLSRHFTLLRGVRQGDPLSPLLYTFSIEPMGMALRCVIKGIKAPGCKTAKLIMFADDMNLFLSNQEDM